MKRFLLVMAAAVLLGGAAARAQSTEAKPYLVIDKQHFTLTHIGERGDTVAVYGVAVGSRYGQKVTLGDRKTPEGTFHINQILSGAGMTHDFHDGKGPVKGAYGPWFFRLAVPNCKHIGIHGTHLPESIGTRSTEGCIRLRNEDITELRKSIFIGMKVIILPDEVAE